MIVTDYLINPVEVTEEMEPRIFGKYIDICNAQKKGEMTNPEMVDEIRHAFYHAHTNVYIGNLNGVWAWVQPKLAVNAGLAQFVLDYKAAESDFFFPWLVNVWNSPSAALEMAYGGGRGLDGKWHTDILEKCDRINYFVHNVPTFVYNRERQLKVADLVSIYQNRANLRDHSKIVDFGAGRMAWATHHKFRFYATRQTIYAFDKDTSINTEDVFELYPVGVSSSWENVKYEHSDFIGQLSNPELAGADLVILGGVASYIPQKVLFGKIVPAIYQLLKPGGSFFFDLQLNCPQYVWSVKLFDWPEIKLMNNASEAIDAVEAARHKLKTAGMAFSADYALDLYNGKASSVMITLTKN